MKLLKTGSFSFPYWLLLIACVFLIELFSPAPNWANILPTWSYDKLFEKSDLVVIATADRSCDAPAKFNEANPWKATFAGVVTVLKVELILKGKEREKTVKVHHFRQKGGGGSNFFPYLASFDTTKGKPDYLVFLRRVSNGEYEPVSGQAYAGLSVFECQQVPPFPKK